MIGVSVAAPASPSSRMGRRFLRVRLGRSVTSEDRSTGKDAAERVWADGASIASEDPLEKTLTSAVSSTAGDANPG